MALCLLLPPTALSQMLARSDKVVVVSVGTKTRPELQDTQKQTFAKHLETWYYDEVDTLLPTAAVVSGYGFADCRSFFPRTFCRGVHRLIHQLSFCRVWHHAFLYVQQRCSWPDFSHVTTHTSLTLTTLSGWAGAHCFLLPCHALPARCKLRRCAML